MGNSDLNEALHAFRDALIEQDAAFENVLRPGVRTAEVVRAAVSVPTPLPDEIVTWLTWDFAHPDWPEHSPFIVLAVAEFESLSTYPETYASDGVYALLNEGGSAWIEAVQAPGLETLQVRRRFVGDSGNVVAPSMSAWIRFWVGFVQTVLVWDANMKQWIQRNPPAPFDVQVELVRGAGL